MARRGLRAMVGPWGRYIRVFQEEEAQPTNWRKSYSKGPAFSRSRPTTTTLTNTLGPRHWVYSWIKEQFGSRRLVPGTSDQLFFLSHAIFPKKPQRSFPWIDSGMAVATGEPILN